MSVPRRVFLHRERAIAYERFGLGRVPLVFLHGLGADRSQSVRLLDPPVHAQVITPDAPGHGESDAAPELWSFAAMADTLVALLDDLGIADAVFGGISMGAGVAINTAIRHPTRVRGLVLVRPAWIDQPNPPNLALVANLGRWIAHDGPDAARARLRADPGFLSLLETIPASAASIEAVLDRPGIDSRAGVLVRMTADAPVSSADQLRHIERPTLVFSTEHDPLHPASLATDLAARIAGATTRPTPPRYLEPERHAAAVREVIRGFLSTIEATEQAER